MANRPTEALALGEAALATHEKTSGPDHPWTKDAARATADALDALGRAEQAVALRARYGVMTAASPNPKLSEKRRALNLLREGPFMLRQIGRSLIRDWRVL
jgi:hypothetical protein